MIRRHGGRWAALLTVFALAACNSASRTNPTPAQPAATATSTTAPMMQPGALFYTKAGSLYVSDPAATPGRKLTDGPVDAQPAPSPDLSHVAFVRKADPSDYGGELWVLDLSPNLEPLGPPRRLVDPATLPDCCDTPPQVVFPRWSPTGQQVAFVDSPNNGAVDGGILLVAAADTGALEPRQQVPGAEWAPYAEPDFAWSPDGSHIAWLNEHSDVRPVNVNALAAVGGVSTPVATDTDAFSVTYAKDGQAILFTNGEAPPDFVSRPFAVKAAGIYSVATPGGAVAKPPSTPTPLFTRQGSSYGNIAALDSGALAFTTSGTDNLSRTIQVLDKGSSLPRTTVTDVAAGSICLKTPRGGGVCHAVQRPAWGAGDFVAYLDTSPERSLVVTDLDNRSPRRVDTGVDTFAWAPRSP
jgi:TolB protein